uniref:non-specific serine/threonine protein kinase n=1 Tax=Nelumbo nucifera TaxID=4432 RepID=A0A822ZP25_NELNU|nr:TPA_asm: hypothetical protein HUJ06_016490 [Nelumbo nucifera]
MGCFSCMSPRRDINKIEDSNRIQSRSRHCRTSSESSSKGKASSERVKGKGSLNSKGKDRDNKHNAAQSFTFRELATATKNFKATNLIGEGGFGRVYKGRLETGQIVAVKQLDQNGLQGNQEFIVEVLMLSLLHHSNLVNLIGYCTDGDQRLLVYEYMPMGSLEDHLFDLTPNKEPLEWNTRMKIAVGAARGLEYLHCKANPPVIYRDLKSANILLDNDFNPKLSDFGLAKLGPVGDNTHVSTRVMGTYGYCAPEYAMSGKLTLKSDVYSFGVVLLELITGRKAIDCTKVQGEQNLVSWETCSQYMFINMHIRMNVHMNMYMNIWIGLMKSGHNLYESVWWGCWDWEERSSFSGVHVCMHVCLLFASSGNLFSYLRMSLASFKCSTERMLRCES